MSTFSIARRLPVNSSHTCLVTQSTRYNRAHNKDTSRKFFYLHAGQVAPRNSAQHGRRNYGTRVYNKTYAMPCSSVWLFDVSVRNIEVTDDGEALESLNATNVRSKSTVNSSQRCQTRRSTRHTILRCDELTGSRYVSLMIGSVKMMRNLFYVVGCSPIPNLGDFKGGYFCPCHVRHGNHGCVVLCSSRMRADS